MLQQYLSVLVFPANNCLQAQRVYGREGGLYLAISIFLFNFIIYLFFYFFILLCYYFSVLGLVFPSNNRLQGQKVHGRKGGLYSISIFFLNFHFLKIGEKLHGRIIYSDFYKKMFIKISLKLTCKESS